MVECTLPSLENFSPNKPTLTRSAVIYASTVNPYKYPTHKTPYVFLTNFVNRGKYILNKKKIEVSDRLFYLSPTGSELEICFSEKQPLQTLLILFEERFFEDSLRYQIQSDKELLENPLTSRNEAMELPNVPYDFANNLKAKILQLLQPSLSNEEMECLLTEWIADFSVTRFKTAGALKRINAIKKTTREELYRRLVLAKELMHDDLSSQLTLEQISSAVFLSKFHFLDTFKSLFGVTPHQYLLELRLQKAWTLLQSKTHSVTEVCYAVGFESPGSFSTSFKKRFRVSPSKVAPH
jgi:AraC family transcriptional regulator